MNEKDFKNYLVSKGHATTESEISLELVAEGESQNHLNYRVATPKTTFLLRATNKENGMLGYSNLADEYTILKMVEKYDVAPHALRIDMEGFMVPIMLEEYLSGAPLSNLDSLDDPTFSKIIDLIVRVSQIDISQEQFPFKFTYTTYEKVFQVWDYRIEEVAKNADSQDVARTLQTLAERGHAAIRSKEKILNSSRAEFIYNDVHPGNIFLLDSTEVKFIDWQKVSLGDPSFMLVLFAKRFGEKWGMSRDVFVKKCLEAYMSKKNVVNQFEELFQARLLERFVSDAIWSVWARVKRGEKQLDVDSNTHVKEVERMLENI